MSLLIVGTVAFDSIETPYGSAERVIGGSGTYFSWAASSLHKDIMLSSIVGIDWPSKELEAMRNRGIDTSGIEVVGNGKSFFWAGKYLDNMMDRETVTTDLNVLDNFNPILSESFRKAEYVMLGNLTPDIQMQVIEQMDPTVKFIAMDTMNFWMDIAWDRLLEVVSKVDLLSINDEEARQLSGKYSLVEAAKSILDMGPSYLIIKKGEHGALLFHQDQIFALPGMPIAEVKDPTGAGDTFAGGLMGYIANQDEVSFETVRTGIVHGSALASFCVEDFSLDRLKNISDDELQNRISAFRNLVAF
ncbi:MAG: bifunctional hydroxymethylpyrimidine kinase/phosphomethylpyrimidine kinase [Saprospiraceae bacterium]|nr:bifunctional hydroxymethylpyrimidine kinase/phosphomethylpyrimidine kinase [Saprospiraceae bacterium]